jgi:hypothetical protein
MGARSSSLSTSLLRSGAFIPIPCKGMGIPAPLVNTHLEMVCKKVEMEIERFC